MKAIDFACNFLRQLHECPLSAISIRILFCVAAGLNYRDDIISFLEPGNNSSIVACLHRLEKQKLVLQQNRSIGYYILTSEGKRHITALLKFLPRHSSHA
ncbi:MAG: hypothetical protein IKZ13_03975 [Akkermansia sp.]|nr:hypothetical protein [Akkermansia sp.]